MAEGIFLLVVAGVLLLMTTMGLSHIFRFYAIRLAHFLLRIEKASRNVSPEGTKEAHLALKFMQANYDREQLQRIRENEVKR